MPKIADAILMFAPEHWGEVIRFQKFWSSTHVLDDRAQRALAGVGSHLEKCITLTSLAEKLRPNLQIDKTELDERGFTSASNANEITTVVEAAILELYSSVDCTAKVLRAIYGAETNGFKNSTRGIFQNIRKMSGSFPEELKEVIENASWYWQLHHLRDELTHLATGSVHLDEKTGHVSYHHYGLKRDNQPLILEDVFGWLDKMTKEVNQFLGILFHHLNNQLEDKPIFQICGMVQGRALHRFVSPVGELTFNSGTCGAWVWFEKPENPTCPFKENCGAYLRTRSKNH